MFDAGQVAPPGVLCSSPSSSSSTVSDSLAPWTDGDSIEDSMTRKRMRSVYRLHSVIVSVILTQTWTSFQVNGASGHAVRVVVEDTEVKGVAAGKGSAVRAKGWGSLFSSLSVGSSCGWGPLTLVSCQRRKTDKYSGGGVLVEMNASGTLSKSRP